MLKVIAICSEPKGCPVYKDEDKLSFTLPVVEGLKNVPVCAIAAGVLHPKAQSIIKGESMAGDLVMTSCGGCEGGEAWFDFVVQEEKKNSLPPQVLKVLSKMPIFSNVTEDHLAKVLRLMNDYRAQAGQVLIADGGTVEVFFILLSGAMEVVKTEESGEEKVVATLGAGECFGEMSLITGDPASATVRAAKDSTLLAVSRSDFKTMIGMAPEIGFSFARILAGRLAKTGKWISKELKKAASGDPNVPPPTPVTG